MSVFTYSTGYCRQILTKLEPFSTNLNTQTSNVMKIHPVGAELFMLTDRHDEANSRFLQFCERV